jgi:hypothetical protein
MSAARTLRTRLTRSGRSSRLSSFSIRRKSPLCVTLRIIIGGVYGITVHAPQGLFTRVFAAGFFTLSTKGCILSKVDSADTPQGRHLESKQAAFAAVIWPIHRNSSYDWWMCRAGPSSPFFRDRRLQSKMPKSPSSSYPKMTVFAPLFSDFLLLLLLLSSSSKKQD